MNLLELFNITAATVISVALNSLWLGLLLTGLAAGMLRILPRPNAATRYAVWFTALGLLLASPAMLLIPRRLAPAIAEFAGPAASAPLVVPVTAHWPLYAALVWFVIVIILMARVIWSLIHIHGLKSRATLIAKRDHVRVLSSTEVRVPMAAGFFRRAILFPQSVLEELSSEEFEQVLCHEMAHLRRWDDWTQLIQEIARAVLFFNPAAYWIGRRLTIEREMACDDWVVSATGQARPYAACLAHLHELTRRASAPQLAPGATTHGRWQISARVEALLEPDRNSTTRFSRSGWMAACALASAAFVVTASTPPPVGVQELPLASLAMARLSPPAAPPISLVVHKAAPVRPLLLASRVSRPALPPPPRIAPADPSYMLVHAWRVEVSPSYFVITVVFFEPPPPTALNGI